MPEDNTSTLQSYIDSASGAAQSLYGSITGNQTDKAEAAQKQDKADVEDVASHSVGKLGPFAVGSSGAVSQDDPNRTEGSWNQTVGAAKESIGNFVGAEGLKREGIEQNRQGKGQEAQGQLSDLGSGVGDRIKGTVGAGVAGVMGNEGAREEYQQQHDVGKTQQRSAEADIQKQGGDY